MALSEEEKRRIFEEEQLRMAMKGKNVVVAVILSALLPGLGDLYCGSWMKALVFLALAFVTFILMFVVIGIFLFPAVWVGGLISAWLSAKKSQERELGKVERSLPQQV